MTGIFFFDFGGLPFDPLPSDGLPFDGLPFDGLPFDGLPSDGLSFDGLHPSLKDDAPLGLAPNFRMSHKKKGCPIGQPFYNR